MDNKLLGLLLSGNKKTAASIEEVKENLRKNYLTSEEIKKFVDAYNESAGGSDEDDNEPCDWNELKNKPFYEEHDYGDTLYLPKTVDELNGLESCETYTGTYYLVYDAAITIDDCKNGSTTIWTDGGGTEFTYEDLQEQYQFGVGGFKFDEGLLTTTNDAPTYIVGGTAIGMFPKYGIWLKNESVGTIVSLTIPGFGKFPTTTIKPIESKYLPSNLATKEYVEELLGVIENGTY